MENMMGIMTLAECRGVDWCRNIEGKLRAANRYARNLIEASPDPMILIDLQGRVMDVNFAAEEISGVSREQLIGSEFSTLFAEQDKASALLRLTLVEEKQRDFTMHFRHLTRRMAEVSCNASVLHDADGRPEGVVVVARDVSDFRQVESQMLFQANYDALTTLPNRQQFRECLRQVIGAEGRTGRMLGILFVDIDNFKDINETLGYEIGDELITATALRFRENLPPSDVVARMGGDEFAILIEDGHGEFELELMALKLLAVVVEPHLIEGHEVVVSCSIGISLYPFAGGGAASDVDNLLGNAEAALYRAKSEGKNCCRHFTSEMNSTLRRRVDLGNRLRRALKDSEFILHYQPRVELAGGRIAGVEALIRWKAKDIGMVSPAEFIAIAERNGMIIQIGEWVLFEACRQAREWQTEHGLPVRTAVNLSARQFFDTDIVAQVMRALEHTGLPAQLLELELTESMLIHDVKRVQQQLGALKELGVKLSVDDFGTGYSSLSYLNTFPIDCLKVDRSFVNHVSVNSGNKAIVRAIIVLAHSLGLDVVAEGVETGDQLEFLLDQDCEEIQGYYFSKPLAVDAITALLREKRVYDLGR